MHYWLYDIEISGTNPMKENKIINKRYYMKNILLYPAGKTWRNLEE